MLQRIKHYRRGGEATGTDCYPLLSVRVLATDTPEITGSDERRFGRISNTLASFLDNSSFKTCQGRPMRSHAEEVDLKSREGGAMTEVQRKTS